MRVALVFAMVVPCLARAQSGEDILLKVDHNMTFGTRIAEAEMLVTRPNGVDKKTLKIWSRGESDSYVEFLAPARDKGTKYLKVEDNLYMFLPTTEKVVKISGHLLRQSLMDSDFSYEDMLESKTLADDYDVTMGGDEAIDGEPCWVLDLSAKRDGAAYHRRKLWVSRKTFLPLRQHLFAKSGSLLKEMETAAPVPHGPGFYPGTLVMRDRLKKGSETRLVMRDIQFDAAIPDSVFSRRHLMQRR